MVLCSLHQRFSSTTNRPSIWAVRLPHSPIGKLWIGLSRSAGFSKTRHAVMLGVQLRRLGFRRGYCFTSGQGRIDLRFIRSMLSTQVLGGSPHECQCPDELSRVTRTVPSHKPLGVVGVRLTEHRNSFSLILKGEHFNFL